MFGNRGIYHEGWTAVTRHSIPWDIASAPPNFDGDRWELYHVDRDFSQAEDLAAKAPAKLAELKAVFDREALANNVFPLDARRSERFDFRVAGRPDLMNGRRSLTVFPGMVGMPENAFINVKGEAHRITADIDVPRGAPVEGVVIAQAGRFAGWTLFTANGRPSYEYNWFGLERTRLSAPDPLPPGRHVVEVEVTPESAKPGAPARAALRVNGQEVATALVPKTIPFAFSGDEGTDVGRDNETPVSEAYREGDNAFTGSIEKVTITLLPRP